MLEARRPFDEEHAARTSGGRHQRAARIVLGHQLVAGGGYFDGVDGCRVAVRRDVEGDADGGAVRRGRDPPQIDRAAVLEEPELDWQRSIAVRDGRVDHGIAHDRLRRGNAGDLAIAPHGAGTNAERINGRAACGDRGRIHRAVVAAVADEDDAGDGTIAITLLHGLQGGAQSRAPVSGRKSHGVARAEPIAEAQHVGLKSRRERGEQIVLHDRSRAVDPWRAVDVRETHAARGVNQDRYDRAASRGSRRPRERAHETDDNPQQRRETKRRKRTAPER